MPITVSWDNKQEPCLIIEFNSVWLWQELIDALDQATSKSDESAHDSVNFVFDMGNSIIFPRDATFKMKRQHINIPERIRHAVVIGTGQFPQLFFNFLLNATHGTNAQVLHFASKDEAQATLCPT